jgi:type I restriction enzyme, S subunit
MNPAQLLSYFDRICEAPDAIPTLRRFILDLAVRGKLVAQDHSDEPASDLLKLIQAEKLRMAKAGLIKDGELLPSSELRPFDLPDGWEWTQLGNTGRVFNGNSVSEDEKAELSKVTEGYPFIATKDVGYGGDTLAYKNGIRVPFDAPGFKVAHAQAVLICSEGGSAGKKIGLTDRDVCFGNKLYANETWSGIHQRYILAVYQSAFFFEEFSARMTGIIGGIARSEFVRLPVPIPPEAEQRRIVGKVDELMTLCDRLEVAQARREQHRNRLVTVSLHRVSQYTNSAAFREHVRFHLNHFPRLTTSFGQIEELRQTILNLAVQGRLVKQDPGDEPASDLLKRITRKRALVTYEGTTKKPPLSTIVPDAPLFDIPVGWIWIRVQQLLEPNREISYGIIKLGDEPKIGGVRTIRCSDVKPRSLDLTGVRSVSEEIERDYQRTRLSGGEILLNIRGTLGGVALVPRELKGYNVAREVAVIPISTELSGEYLVDVMASPYFWQAILQSLRGIAYKGLNLNALRFFEIPLPPFDEQKRIVAKVNELMALCDQLEAQLTTTQTESHSLLEAVLHEALNNDPPKPVSDAQNPRTGS